MRKEPNAIVLAFDFGTRRVGAAIGNTLTHGARALATLENGAISSLFEQIAALIEEWRPAQLVVGLPVHSDGTPHAMTARAQRFARQLETRFALPVALVDERWTTQAAEDTLRNTGRGGRGGRAQRDESAATIILQAWLDEQHET